MIRYVVATIVAVLAALVLCLAEVANAADAAHLITPTCTLLSEPADIHVSWCDATHFITYNRGATVNTNALHVYTQTGTSWCGLAYNGPVPVTSGYGKMRAQGCNATQIREVGGGTSASPKGDWVAVSSLSDPGNWTVTRDVSTGSDTDTMAGEITVSPTLANSKSFASVYQYQPAAGTTTVFATYSYNVNPVSFGNFSGSYVASLGTIAFTDECAGILVTSAYYYTACVGASQTSFFHMGWNGTNNSRLFDPGNSTACNAYNSLIRPAFTDGTLGIVLSTNGSSTRICGVTSTGTNTISQNIAALMRGGVTWGGVATIYKEDGTCYQKSGSSFVTNSSCDITSVLAGATIRQVIGLFDSDGDLTADDFLSVNSNGTLAYVGATIVPATSGLRSHYRCPARLPSPFR